MKLQKLLPLLALALAPFAFAEGKAEKKAAKPDGDKKCDHCDKGDALSDAEKAKVRAAHEAAKKDPAVVAAMAKAEADRDAAKAAREKARESKAEADKDAAKAAVKTAMESAKAAREAMHAAVIKADPSVAELLKKCGPGKKHADCDDCDKGHKEKGKKHADCADCDKGGKKHADCDDCDKGGKEKGKGKGKDKGDK